MKRTILVAHSSIMDPAVGSRDGAPRTVQGEPFGTRRLLVPGAIRGLVPTPALRFGFGLVLGLVVTEGRGQAADAEPQGGAAAPRNEAGADGAARDPSESSEGFLAFARSGLSDLEAGRYASALALFERALLYPSHPGDRATIVFDIGACLAALGRFEEAEERFLESATLAPGARGASRVQAGHAALGARRLEDAKRHLAAARRAGDSPRGALAELEAAIARREAALAVEARLERCAALTERGEAEFAQQRYLEAQRAFEGALLSAATLESAARTGLRQRAALAAYRRGDFKSARGHVEQAIGEAPERVDLRILHARVLLRLGDAAGASRAAHRATELGEGSGTPGELRSELEAQSALPASGWSGHLATLGGWDSEPGRSGVGAEGGLSGGASGSGSGLARAFGGLALTGPSSEHAALRLEYGMEWLGLFAPSAEALSLQSHGLESHWYRELGDRWRLRLGGGGAVRLAGLEAPEAMSYGVSLGAALTLDPTRELRPELELRATRAEGLGEYGYLGGSRFLGHLGVAWFAAPFELEVRVGGQYMGLGTVAFPVTLEQLPACGPAGCEGAEYRVPLAYAAPRIEVGASVDGAGPLIARLGAEGEYRRYLDASKITGEARSSRLRRDWRWRLEVGLELELGEADHFALLADYAWCSSASNVRFDAAHPEHELDYGRYSFRQHVVEVGATARF